VKKTEISKPEVTSAAASAAVYNEIISRIVPVSVTLVGTESSLDRRTSELLKTESAWNEAIVVDGPNAGTHQHEYTIRQIGAFACLPLIGGGKPVFKGHATYEVVIGSEVEIPSDFWARFLKRNVVLYTHPAFRDLAASLVSRANLMALPMGSVAVTQRPVAAPAETDVAPVKSVAKKKSQD